MTSEQVLIEIPLLGKCGTLRVHFLIYSQSKQAVLSFSCPSVSWDGEPTLALRCKVCVLGSGMAQRGETSGAGSRVRRSQLSTQGAPGPGNCPAELNAGQWAEIEV